MADRSISVKLSADVTKYIAAMKAAEGAVKSFAKQGTDAREPFVQLESALVSAKGAASDLATAGNDIGTQFSGSVAGLNDMVTAVRDLAAAGGNPLSVLASDLKDIGTAVRDISSGPGGAHTVTDLATALTSLSSAGGANFSGLVGDVRNLAVSLRALDTSTTSSANIRDTAAALSAIAALSGANFTGTISDISRLGLAIRALAAATGASANLGNVTTTLHALASIAGPGLTSAASDIQRIGSAVRTLSNLGATAITNINNLATALRGLGLGGGGIGNLGSITAQLRAMQAQIDALRRSAGSASGGSSGGGLIGGLTGGSGGLKQLALTAAAYISVGSAVKSTLSAGITFQNNLNTLQAVGHATAAQMQQVSDKAIQLGNDITIPGASASDAASAMVELAKGGLSVQQSMDAAQGTLRLAAAAGTDAASAATVEVNALNGFNMAAGDASKVADALANTANAATGEISDFALGMQQSAAVSHQFNIGLNDNLTALGLFANAGIRGSDAGTSLKTMLLAFTNQSKPAQAAMKTLGVQAFDAQGNFVGLQKVTDQLSAAQANMTQQQFSAAAATAFGSDAVRAASVLAEGGTAAWTDMSTAVGQSGGAAAVANAKMQGLGGALEGFKNAAETAQLELFQKVAPALESVTRTATAFFPTVLAAVSTGTGSMITGVTKFFGPIVSGAKDLALSAWPYVKKFGSDLVGVWDNAVGALKPLSDGIGAFFHNIATNGTMKIFGQGLDTIRDAANKAVGAIAPVTSGIGTFFRNMSNSGVLKTVGDGFVTLGKAAGGLFDALKPIGTAIGGLFTSDNTTNAAGQVATSFDNVASSAKSISDWLKPVGDAIGAVITWFGKLGTPITTATIALGAMLLLRGPLTSFFGQIQARAANLAVSLAASNGVAGAVGAASGGLSRFASFMGGPWGLAIGVGVTALVSWISTSHQSAQATAANQAAIADLAQTVDQVTGALTAASSAKITGGWIDNGVADQFKGIGDGAGEAAQAIVAGGTELDAYRKKIENSAAAYSLIGELVNPSSAISHATDELTDASKKYGVTVDQMKDAALAGGVEQSALADKIQKAGGSSSSASTAMDDYRSAYEKAVPVMGTFDQAVTNAGAASTTTAAKFDAAVVALAGMVKINPQQLTTALDAANKSGESIEATLQTVGITGSRASQVIGGLGDYSFANTTNGLHYLSQAAAATGSAAGITGGAFAALTGGSNAAQASIDATRSALGKQTQAILTLGGAVPGVTGALGALTGGLQTLTDATGVPSYITDMSSAFADFQQAVKDADTQGQLFLFTMQQLSGRNVTDEQAVQANNAAVRAIGSAYRDSAQAVDDYNTLKAAGRTKDSDGKYTQTEAEYERQLADALDKTKDSQDSVNTSMDQYESTAATRIQQVADEANKTGGFTAAVKAAQSEMEKQRAAFIAQQPAADIASGAAAKLADKYGLIPKNVTTILDADPTLAQSHQDDLRADVLKTAKTYDTIPASKSTEFKAVVAEAQADGKALYRTYDATTGKWTASFMTAGDADAKKKAGGVLQSYDAVKGTWTGHLTATDDATSKVLALEATLAGVKDKTVTLTVKQAQAVIDVSNATADARGHATGGLITGPGSGTSDSILARLSNGEGINTAAAMSKPQNVAAMNFMNRGGVIPGFAGGGLIGGLKVDMGSSGSIGDPNGWAAGVMSGMVGAAQKAADAAAADAAAKAAAAAAASVGAGVAQWIPLMDKVFAEKGFPLSQVYIMANQMQHESGGNPNAINLTDINAQEGHPSVGLLQFIPGTFAANADPGFNTNIYDPESQMRAFLNYVPRTYGSLAEFAKRNYGAYATGGRILGGGTGTSDSILARVSNGEGINTAAAMSHPANVSAMNFMNSGGVIPGFATGGIVPAVSALNGSSAPTLGTVASNVAQGLSALADAVSQAKQAAADAVSQRASSHAAAIDASRNQIQVSATGRSNVSAASGNLAQVAKDQAAKVAAAQKATAAANLAATKKATDAAAALKKAEDAHYKTTDARTKAIAAAQKASSAASDKQKATAAAGTTKLNAAEAARTKAVGAAEQKLNAAQAAQAKANTTAQKATDAATKKYVADTKSAAQATQAADAATAAQKVQQRLYQAQQSYAARLDSLTDRISTASQNLADLQTQRSQEITSIADKISGFDSGILGHQDTRTTAATVLQGQQYNVQQAKQFDAEITNLQKMGLSKTLIQQIAEAGVDGGGATALALQGASAAQIKALNDSQSALAQYGTDVGAKVGNQLYNAGIQAAQGIVTGLQSQQAAIQKVMNSIATSLVTTMKTALDIHSPSKVMHSLGAFTGQGFIDGVTSMHGPSSVAMATLATVPQVPQIAPNQGWGYAAQAAPAPTIQLGDIKVFVGDREITDIVRVELESDFKTLGHVVRKRANQG